MTDNWELTKALVSATDAYHPLLYRPEWIRELGAGFVVLRDLVPLPEHRVSIAFSTLQPQSEAGALFAKLLRKPRPKRRSRRGQASKASRD